MIYIASIGKLLEFKARHLAATSRESLACGAAIPLINKRASTLANSISEKTGKLIVTKVSELDCLISDLIKNTNLLESRESAEEFFMYK